MNNNKTEHQSPEYLFCICLFVMMFGLMAMACVFRLLGIGWFMADYSNVPVPSLWAQEVVKFALFWFEACFVLKILCKTNWLKAIGLSLICAISCFAICTFIGNVCGEIFNTLFIVICPLFFIEKYSVKAVAKCLLSSIALIAITMLYGMTMLFGRYSLNSASQYSYIVGILSTIDYKLLFVNMYLFQKLKGGEKICQVVCSLFSAMKKLARKTCSKCLE
ncbi:MAG: hypothetical protein RSC01_02510 [Oscillospiraceae bacterium]